MATSKIIVQIGTQPTVEYAIEQAVIVFGREKENTIFLSDPEVSRRHFRFIREADGYAIEDLGSTNGTYVNHSLLVEKSLLRDGDVITAGQAVNIVYKSAMNAAYDTIKSNIPSASEIMAVPRDPYDPYVPQQSSVHVQPSAVHVQPSAIQQPSAPIIVEESPMPQRDAYQRTTYQQQEQQPYQQPYQQQEDPAYQQRSYQQQEDQYYYPETEEVNESSGCLQNIGNFGCGALLVLSILCVFIWILDATNPEWLYCGSFRSLWESVLTPFLNLIGYEFSCA